MLFTLVGIFLLVFVGVKVFRGTITWKKGDFKIVLLGFLLGFLVYLSASLYESSLPKNEVDKVDRKVIIYQDGEAIVETFESRVVQMKDDKVLFMIDEDSEHVFHNSEYIFIDWK